MRRYWVNEEKLGAEFVLIDGENFHHIVDVCRQGLGSRFEVLGRGREALLVEIVEVTKRSARARVISLRDLPLPQPPHVQLFISLPRLPTFELIIEKSVELAVSKVIPFCSDFSHFREPKLISPERRLRWEKIVRGATQQSGRGDLMPIEECRRFPEIMDDLNPAHTLFAFEGETPQTVRQFLRQSAPNQRTWNLVIGSEGGFSAKEVTLAEGRGFKPVSLGEQVLRVETACISLVSILKYELAES